MDRLLIVLLACLTFVSYSASAAIISFDDGANPNQDGTLSYDGDGGVLTGDGIDFFTIIGEDTPLNNNTTLTCVDCVLNFVTGNNISEPTGSSPVWVFSGPGELFITGTVMDGATTIVDDDLLVSGTFSQATVSGSEPGAVLIFSGIGGDSKHDNLIDFFGLSNPFTFASTDISIGNANFLENGGFNGTVTNADFDNISIVPVPAAVWLFGSGLLGLVGIARRKAA